MENKVLEYINIWNESQPEHKGTRIMPLVYESDIYKLEIRFPSTAYECVKSSFSKMEAVLLRNSGGVLYVVSSWEDFRHGILSLNVAFCNNAYISTKVVATLNILMTEIIPSLKK